MADKQGQPATLVEAAMQSNRLAAVVLLVIVPVTAWVWIVAMARDMYGSMQGTSAWMMTPAWDLPHVLLLWAMWAAMMTGMMIPSAAPTVLLYGAMVRRSADRNVSLQIYALAGGYLTIWIVFSLAATALQGALARLLLMSPMMEPTSPLLASTLLFAAGAYQLTSLKQMCLRTCRSPFGFLMSCWRAGPGGAFRMGLQHGTYCVGCCWALMLLLFVGGVMNLAVIAALTVFVALEKLLPLAPWSSRLSGMLLIAMGIWMITR